MFRSRETRRVVPVHAAATLALLLLMVAVLMGCGTDTTSTAAPEGSEALSYESDSGVGGERLPGDPSERWEHLVEALQLTDEQIEALQPAFDEFHEAMQALRTGVREGELSREEAARRREVLNGEFEAFLQDVLSPEQYDQWQELRENHPHPGSGGGRPGHGNGPEFDPAARWAELAEVLGLSEDQLTTITEAAEQLRASMQDLRSQVRAGELTRGEAAELAESLRADFDLFLQGVLTPEQYEQLQELRPDPPDGGGPGGGGPGHGSGHGGR